MIVTIHQPEYLPYIGFFSRVAASDIFIILDDVGYQKNAFINRNRIKTAQGSQWITVPVQGRSPNKLIKDIRIDNTKGWKDSIVKAIFLNYKKAPYFDEYFKTFQETFAQNWDSIAEFDIILIKKVLEILGVQTKIEISSAFNVAGEKVDKLINLCKAVGGDIYLSGPGNDEHGLTEEDLKKFENASSKVIFQEFKHPTYRQQFMDQGFLPYMSIADLLFNEGPKSIDIIKNANK